jgi:RNA polymerase sigma-70 factor (ECF subfamily)
MALVAFLTSRDGDLDEKDRLLASLIAMSQEAGIYADLASSLLWLSMWPALDHCYRRRLKHFSREPEELVALISVSFTTLVGRMDLNKVARVASTLALSTDRDVLNACKKRWEVERVRTDLPDEDDPGGRPIGRRWGESPLVVAPKVSDEAQIDTVRTRLRRTVGDDADLLINVAIAGYTVREIADRTGVKHETVRKRFQRAADRFRVAVSHSSPQDGVSFTGPMGPRRRAR